MPNTRRIRGRGAADGEGGAQEWPLQRMPVDMFEDPPGVPASQVTRRIRIENRQGLHARPAASIVRLLRDTRSSVKFTYRKQTVDAHSVLSLLMLGAPKNAWITISADGPDAIDTLEKLEEAFRQRFGEQG